MSVRIGRVLFQKVHINANSNHGTFIQSVRTCPAILHSAHSIIAHIGKNNLVEGIPVREDRSPLFCYLYAAIASTIDLSKTFAYVLSVSLMVECPRMC